MTFVICQFLDLSSPRKRSFCTFSHLDSMFFDYGMDGMLRGISLVAKKINDAGRIVFSRVPSSGANWDYSLKGDSSF